jgi:adenylate kinase
VGPQGSGKGTQGVRIAEASAVSTGDIFRANVKEGTELGKQVKAIIDAGDLVPTSSPARSCATGSPSPTRRPASSWTATRATSARSAISTRSWGAGHLARRGDRARRAARESIARIAVRAVEQGRADDNPMPSRSAWTSTRQTAPILDVYGARGIVDTIDGVGSLDEVTERIFAALSARGIVRTAAV